MIISFDMDGTLADMQFDKTIWFTEIPKLYAQKKGINFEEAKNFCSSEYNKIGDEDLRWYDVRYWLKHFKLENDWKTFIDDLKHHIKLYPETIEVLEDLSKNHKLIVISNAPRQFLDLKIEIEGISKYFYKVFSVTTDFKKIKKTEEVYKKICEILEIQPKDLIHIGDHYKFDFKIPQKIGIKSFYLDRKEEKLKEEGVVKNLKEFKEKISLELY